MIKRPLVWVLGAYLAGILSAYRTVPAIWIILFCLLLYVVLYLLRRGKTRWFEYSDRFLWCLPLLLLVGYLAMQDRMKMPDFYDTFEHKVSCELSGSIKKIIQKEQGQVLYITGNEVKISEQEQYQCEKVMIYTTSLQSFRVGNHITAIGTLLKFLPASNPGQFNEQLYYKTEAVDFKMQADDIIVTAACYSWYHYALDSLKRRLLSVYSSVLKKKEAGILSAMLLGEKYLLEDEVKQLYQTGGISHLLAISGLHISLLGLGLFRLLRKCRLSNQGSALITALLIFGYGELTGFRVSTNRAVVMMFVLLIASLLGKTYDLLSAISLSALLILLQNPFQLFSAGFQLSFSAVLGIAVLLPLLQKLCPQKHSCLDILFVNISVTAATAPVVLFFFYQFPLYGVLVNLMIFPLITTLVLTALIAGITGLLWLPAGAFFAGGANYILLLYEMVCRINDQLPSALITAGKPGGQHLFLYTLLLFLFIVISSKKQRKSSLILLGTAVLVLFVPHKNPGLEVTVLDVGQGDAICMVSRTGTVYLIDGGSVTVSGVGEFRIAPFLKSKGIDQIDYAIITHSDQDHVSGITELIKSGEISVKRLLLPNIRQKDENYLELEELAADKGTAQYYIGTGDKVTDGALEIYCLHPASDYSVTSANSYSTVLSVSYGEFDLLLTGDLEEDAEKMIAQQLKDHYYEKEWGIHPATDYDVLKVAHHGSRNSTAKEFLQYIQPELALISCGKSNSYGHPHPELLDRLSAAGGEIMITYERGAITLMTDGKILKVEQYQ